MPGWGLFFFYIKDTPHAGVEIEDFVETHTWIARATVFVWPHEGYTRTVTPLGDSTRQRQQLTNCCVATSGRFLFAKATKERLSRGFRGTKIRGG